MADKWAQYAEPAASAPPPGADKWAQYAEAPAPPAAKEQPGFLESAWNAINPAPAVREWLNRPQAHRDAADALVAGMRAHNEKRQPTPAEQQIIDRGMQANLQHPEGNILAEMAGPGAGAAGQAKEGNYAGAAGTLVGGYGVPAALGALGGSEAVKAVPTAVKGAAKGAGSAATEMVPFSRYGLKVSAPKPVVTGAAGAAAARLMGLPAEAGAVVGAAAPIVKGAYTGAKAALAERLAGITEKAAAAERAATAAAPKRIEAPPDASFVRSVPTQYPPSRQLGPGPAPPIITAAPADASFVRSVPAEYPPGGKTAPAGPPPVPEPPMDLLDGIAQGQAGKPFNKLDATQQGFVRDLARRIQDPTPLHEQTAPLPPTRAPDVPAEPPPPEPAQAAAPPAAPPVPQSAAIAQQLADEMHRSGTAPVEESSPVLESPQSGYTAAGELKSPALRAAEITGANRSNRASIMAKALHENGIPLSDAKNISPEQWQTLSESTGGKIPSQQTIDATMVELGKLGQKPGAAALQAAKAKNGAMVAASKAKLTPKAAVPGSEVTAAPAAEAPSVKSPTGNGWKDGKFFIEKIPSTDPDKTGGYTINQLGNGKYQPMSSSGRNNATFANYSFDSLEAARSQVKEWNQQFFDSQSGASASKAGFASRMESTVNRLVDKYRSDGPAATQQAFDAAASDLGTAEKVALKQQFQTALKGSGADLTAASAASKAAASKAKLLTTAKPPAEMTAGQVNAALEKVSKQSNTLNDEFLKAGRGNERPSDRGNMSDPLTKRYNEIEAQRFALQHEVRQRAGPNMSRLPIGRGFGPRKTR